MSVGLGSKLLADNGAATGFSDGLISFYQVVVLMLPLTMTTVAEVHGLVGLKDHVHELQNGAWAGDEDPQDLVTITNPLDRED